MDGPAQREAGARRLMLVGPSTRFLSGIAYYTYGLAGGLAGHFDLSVLLIRRLVPQWLYPGGQRVGDALSELTLPGDTPRFDGIDWFWGPSMVRAVRFLRRERPEILVLQWWTGTVLHSYLLLALVARRMGVDIVLEFHEGLDSAEEGHRVLALYVRLVSPLLFGRCSAFVVHSEFDRKLLADRYDLEPDRLTVIPHALYSHTKKGGRRREAPDGVCNLLFFGLIRPIKGLDLLIKAMAMLGERERDHYWLTIVGETWENCEQIVDDARKSSFGERTTIVNRYVSDDEADEWFGGADAVVLPYRSSSQSGVLHMAMGYDLPVVITSVGGLNEAVGGYGAAVQVPPDSPAALLDGIRRLQADAPRANGGGQTWEDSAAAYDIMVDKLHPPTQRRRRMR